MNRLFLALSVVLAIAPVHAQPGKPNAGLPTIKLSIGQHTLTAEVAANEAQRSIGLMNRFSMPPDHGMLFVFDEVRPLSFWMRNTYVALSIAFIDEKGRIVNIEDMAPHDERSTWSTAPALYALEMKKGWFAQKGIAAGTLVQGLPAKARE
ncbi:MAG TPA: DUF192 domain-containing protein [Casimicrobiaceae bacterium]|nr:DUF192 domain-containing protein [Casimicrobiaceae bacterium]